MEKDPNKRSKGELVVMAPQNRRRARARPADACVIVQLLSIRDNHPQWRTLRREDNAVAAYKYAAQLKDFSAPHELHRL